MSVNKIIQIMPAPADLFAKFMQKDKSIDPSWAQDQDAFYEMEVALSPEDESGVVLFLRVICLALMSDGQITGVPFSKDGIFEPEDDAVGYEFKHSISLKSVEKSTLSANAAPRGPQPTSRLAAMRWLEGFLKNGPQKSAAVKVAASAAGHSYITLQRAKGELGVLTDAAQPYWWRMPVKAHQNIEPCLLGSISFQLAPSHPLIEVLSGHGVVYEDKQGNAIAYGVPCEGFLVSGSGGCAMEYGGTLRHDPEICKAGRAEAAK